MLKRILDIALAGLLLIVSLPVLAVAAIAIELDSEGPILFRQSRVGRGFRRFELFKLRTMRISSGGPVYTSGNDPRITFVGRRLRWLKVDELPQLWNVVRGEMSLVGPRPVVPEIALEFRPFYRRLLAVRPGLTDPATLKYCREDDLLAAHPDPDQYFKTVLTPDKLRLSAAYLERATLWSDLGLLTETALALFFPSSWRPRFMRNWLSVSGNAGERLFSDPVQTAEVLPVVENV